MAEVKVRKVTPTWDLYIMRQSGNALLAKNVPLNTFLTKYFINLKNNIVTHPEYSNDEIIDIYKKLWEKQGTLRSYYNDSWGHKWACFPHNKRLISYIETCRNEVKS